jgi:hypothetical protein
MKRPTSRRDFLELSALSLVVLITFDQSALSSKPALI